jgi:hypothetical protein
VLAQQRLQLRALLENPRGRGFKSRAACRRRYAQFPQLFAEGHLLHESLERLHHPELSHLLEAGRGT